MKGCNERKFRRYAEYYAAKYGENVWIDKVHKTPSWLRGDKKNNAYAVYFRRIGMDGALLTGHGPSYDAAFGMLLRWFMNRERVSSDAEMEIKYAVAGV